MTELTSVLIVMVTDNSPQAERLRGIVSGAGYRVLPVADLQTAEARIAGGGVDMVVMRLSSDPQKLREAIASLRKRNAELPIVLLARDDSSDLSMTDAGALPRLGMGVEMPPIVPEAGLLPAINKIVEQRRLTEQQHSPQEKSRRNGCAGIVSLQGVKGGVGTSTVALNLAALLARHGKTILAELRPGQGTLASGFRLRRKVRTLEDLEAIPAATIAASDVEDCLWRCQQVSGLSILFGPSGLERNFDWTAHVKQILGIAARIADYVVVDLPHCVSCINRSALRKTDCLLLVLERDELCLQAGKTMLAALELEKLLPHSTGAVVVTRFPLAAPSDLKAVEQELKIPLFGSLPPAADLCNRAFHAETPVVALDPESSLAASFAHLEEALPAALRAPAAPMLA